jgi:hypothetical protein
VISAFVKVFPPKVKEKSKLAKEVRAKSPLPGSPSKLKVPVPTSGGVTVTSSVLSNSKLNVRASALKGKARVAVATVARATVRGLLKYCFRDIF